MLNILILASFDICRFDLRYLVFQELSSAASLSLIHGQLIHLINKLSIISMSLCHLAFQWFYSCSAKFIQKFHVLILFEKCLLLMLCVHVYQKCRDFSEPCGCYRHIIYSIDRSGIHYSSCYEYLAILCRLHSKLSDLLKD